MSNVYRNMNFAKDECYTTKSEAEKLCKYLTDNKDKNRVISSKNGTAFYSFWLCHKIGLQKIFNKLENSGKEFDVEEYELNGNVIEENHMNLFNL